MRGQHTMACRSPVHGEMGEGEERGEVVEGQGAVRWALQGWMRSWPLGTSNARLLANRG